MRKYFSERELNYFIRKYEVSGEWDFILKLWDEGELNFRMPFRDRRFFKIKFSTLIPPYKSGDKTLVKVVKKVTIPVFSVGPNLILHITFINFGFEFIFL